MRPLIARREARVPTAQPETGPAIARRGEALQPAAVPHDPAPSRLSYRAQRLWLTPVFRKALNLGLPLFVLFASVSWYLSDEARVTGLFEAAAEIRREIENRPEFRVNVLGIDGAGEDVTEEVRAALALDLPISSFDLDLDELRGRLEALPSIRTADLRIQSGGYLAVRVDEREPAALWLTHDGLSIIDGEGVFIAGIDTRTPDRPLPLLAGEGADLAIAEALDLVEAAAPLGDRLHGLVRVGQRRWDIVLTNETRIQLPEIGAQAALDRILALQDVGEILSRDLTAVDMRNPERPTVRLSEEAVQEFRRLRALEMHGTNGERRG